jgi:ribonuclease HII
MIGGADEAGRGPVVGPLVVAGVVFKDDVFLKENNVRDSKKCTPKTREILAEKIKANAISYEIAVVSASDIDDLRKVMTLNELEVDIFSRIIDKLRPDVCYVDSADVNDKRFGRDISSKLSSKVEIISEHKADEIYPIVGAASILAKTTRDEHVRKIAVELEERLGVPLGSGYPADPVTMNFLRTWVEKYGDLPPYVRCSWETSQNLLKENKTRKLDDF